ncbi:MAG: transcription-repair coupling factor, partial [Armatimonadota bacterium]|nr:transcription-repair coupling factor [Armatimonadota bacterium]
RWEEYFAEHHPEEGEAQERRARQEMAAAVEEVRRHAVVYLTLGARSPGWEARALPFPMAAHPCGTFPGGFAEAVGAVKEWRASGRRVVIASEGCERLIELLTENHLPATRELPVAGSETAQGNPVICLSGTLSGGFALPGAGLVLCTDREVFGRARAARPRRVAREGQRIVSVSQLREGDFVVHINHGIGRFRGLTTEKVAGVERDYLLLEYADNQRLYVPVDQIDRVTRYVGSEEHPPQLHRIGGGEWALTKRRAQAKVREMAGELLQLYAARQAAQGHAFSPDTPWQAELEESFVYEETPDQLRAIRDVKHDMEQPQPMDRLICGDVGYGKTEVAIRAAFKALMDGKQVAVLVPTTVLAQQHYNTFCERLAAFPARIAMLSRFRSPRDQAAVVRGLKEGSIDIVVGTHRLLSRDVRFRDLGLLIVDEEQRFGVAHKERLKQLRVSVDVLTLTATPIPRTLHMSLSGIRDMSVINDPPEGRTPIRTMVIERDEATIREAICRELDRDGQVYFVHNRVETIEAVAERLRRLVPHARVAVAHGQMPEDRLEKVMLDFYDRAFDVLVCTTIIESGLDIPNANTILIDHAPHLGLAQLYQLRGRVGRSPRQAYCYLMYDPRHVLNEPAQKRLDAIREFTELGSGLQIALRDLEIRGAGNLLGAEQHGFMLSVGFELYCQMVADAIRELKGEESTEVLLPPADLPVDAYLPASYVPDDNQRFLLYRRLAGVRSHAEAKALEEELRERFGPEPAPVANLLEVLRLRLEAAAVGVVGLSAAGNVLTAKLSAAARFSDKEVAWFAHHPAANRPGWRWTQVRPDRIVAELRGASPASAAWAILRAIPDRVKVPVSSKERRRSVLR